MNMNNSMNSMLATLGPAAPKDRTCALCEKSEPAEPTPEQVLKKCSRCQTSLYCSRECQKAHWKATHKTQCTFGAINNNIYLDSLSEQAAMEQLIDAYRMRVEDDYKFRGDDHGLYAMEDPLPDFRAFLNRAEAQMNKVREDKGPKKSGILPSWWDKEKRRECERKATRAGGWSSLHSAVEKHDIQEHYKDSMMPMKLRMLAEKVYGFNVMSFE